MKEFSKYLTEIEVSEITGISKSCLQQHRWLRKGLPYIKIGRSVRYKESDIMAYLDQLKVQTKPPLKNESPLQRSILQQASDFEE